MGVGTGAPIPALDIHAHSMTLLVLEPQDLFLQLQSNVFVWCLLL